MEKKRAFVVTGLATAIALSILLLAPAAADSPESSVAPYRFPLSTPKSIEADLNFYKERIARTPGSGLDLAALAGLQLKQARAGAKGMYDVAEKTARQSLEALPAYNTGARLVLAEIAQARHDFAESIRLCRDDAPSSVESITTLIKADLAIGKLEEAHGLADELVMRLPLFGSFVLRALVLSARGRSQEATKEFGRAFAREEGGDIEKAAWARAMYGRHLLREGDLKAAREALLESIRIWPSSPLAIGYLADLEMKLGEFPAADRHYSRAFQMSGEATYLAKKADVKDATGEAAVAKELRGQAESMLRDELTRTGYGHRRALAQILLQTGGNQEALELLRKELEIRRDAETLDLTALALTKLNRSNEAKHYKAEARRLDGKY